jgi:hypothetical protein
MKKAVWTTILGFLLAPISLAQTASQRETAPAAPVAPAPAPVTPSIEPQNWFAEPEEIVSAQRWTFGCEYLLWWVKRAPIPAPLITTTTEFGQGLPAELTGSLGDPNTLPLIDEHDMDYGAFSGLRLRGGVSTGTIGLALGGFLLERRSAGGDVAGDIPPDFSNFGGFPFIAQPFFDVEANQENAYFISVPTFSTGAVNVASQLKLFGYEVSATARVSHHGTWTTDAFIGHRFLGLNENLIIDQHIISLAEDEAGAAVFFLGDPVLRDGAITIHDAFRASNRFYGGQIGSVSRWTHPCGLEVVLRGSIAFGVNQQLVDIRGSTVLTPPSDDPDQTIRGAAGGTFAQPSNIGRHFRNQSSIVHEGELALHYRLTSTWTAKIGYNFLYWTNVVRPGNHIDRRLDRRGVPSDPNFEVDPDPSVTLPAFSFRNSDIWAAGLTFGLEWIY